MPLLDVWSTLNDPAWLFFGIAVAIGGGALAALLFLYPFGRD
jgi:hypothetical protein